ncbi:MAG TPA: hypothetical protein VGB03_01630 [Acidimicrobiales bacterium]
MRRWALVALAAVAACGTGGGGASSVLEEATEKLAEVRSGELHLRVTASTLAADAREVGFDVKGPFALSDTAGGLPKVRFAYTDLLGAKSATTTFVSDGDRAFVEHGGRTTPVPEDDVAHLRGKADTKKAAALGGLRLDEWADDPEQSEDGGTVTAEVDAVAALNDVFGVAASVGADSGSTFPRIEGKDAERFRRAVRSSRMEVETAGDNVLRALRLVIELAPPDADKERIQRLLGRFNGARLAVTLELDRVNQPVEVSAPTR